jgi:hypothetical protein
VIGITLVLKKLMMPCHQHSNASLRDISSLRLLSGARKLVRVGPRSNRGVHIEESFAPGRLGLRGDDDKRVVGYDSSHQDREQAT